MATHQRDLNDHDRVCDHARGHTKLTTTDTYLNATTRLLYELTSG